MTLDVPNPTGNQIRVPPMVTVIAPIRGWPRIQFRNVWRYRHLLYFLGWRDIRARYKQTLFGPAWAFLQPVLMLAIFAFFFSVVARVSSEGYPYPIYVFSALVPWYLISNGVAGASASVSGSSALVTKVYFPRLILPFSSVLGPLLDLAIALAVLEIVLLGFGFFPSWRVIFLPTFIVWGLTIALGVGLWAAALNAIFRDVQFIVFLGLQAWLFLSPIAYPSLALTEPWRTLYALNPVVGYIDGFRWAMLGAPLDPPRLLALGMLMALVVFVSGILMFRKLEPKFADYV